MKAAFVEQNYAMEVLKAEKACFGMGTRSSDLIECELILDVSFMIEVHAGGHSRSKFWF